MHDITDTCQKYEMLGYHIPQQAVEELSSFNVNLFFFKEPQKSQERQESLVQSEQSDFYI